AAEERRLQTIAQTRVATILGKIVPAARIWAIERTAAASIHIGTRAVFVRRCAALADQRLAWLVSLGWLGLSDARRRLAGVGLSFNPSHPPPAAPARSGGMEWKYAHRRA